MKGTCSYRLSTNQILRAMMLRSRFILVLLPLLPVLGGVSWAIWNFSQGLMAEKPFIDWIMGSLMTCMAVIFFTFAFLQIRAKNAPQLPAGNTVLDWSPSGLAARTDQEMYAFRWEDVRWRSVKDGILLSFPNGRFTYVTSSRVSDADRASLHEALNASKMWSRDLR